MVLASARASVARDSKWNLLISLGLNLETGKSYFHPILLVKAVKGTTYIQRERAKTLKEFEAIYNPPETPKSISFTF